jgi:hypothetical protein
MSKTYANIVAATIHSFFNEKLNIITLLYTFIQFNIMFLRLFSICVVQVNALLSCQHKPIYNIHIPHPDRYRIANLISLNTYYIVN